MQVVKTIAEVRRLVGRARADGNVVGLVPTMGALHAGHASLIDACRAGCDYVVVSIFVNPTQFAPSEDLDAYPRTSEADLQVSSDHGADLVFMPDVDEVYPDGPTVTEVAVAELSDKLCGRARPGHFNGVCTVVAKLLNIVAPDRTYFGAKDYQQSLIIRRMVADLNFPVEVVVCPTLREADGLAMSSRNVYLDDSQRAQASELWVALQGARDMINRDRPPAEKVIEGIRSHLAQNAPDGEEDYIKIVNPCTLADVQTTDKSVVIALAVKFASARLIDNILVDGVGA